LDCGGKVLRDAAFVLKSGEKRVAEYLAAAVQMGRRSPSHIKATLIQGALFDTLEAAI